MSLRLLRFSEVKQKVGLGRTTLWKLEKESKFPKRRQVGPNAVAWLESEIDQWISERAKQGEEPGGSGDAA